MLDPRMLVARIQDSVVTARRWDILTHYSTVDGQPFPLHYDTGTRTSKRLSADLCV
jgi:hypothetical protein